MIDLVYANIMDARRMAKITILRRPNGTWERAEVSKLVGYLKPLCIVSQHPKHTDMLMLHGEFSRESTERILGIPNFEHRVFAGLDNPELPFPVPSL